MNDDQIRVAIKTVAARLERAVDSKTVPRVSSLAEHVIEPARKLILDKGWGELNWALPRDVLQREVNTTILLMAAALQRSPLSDQEAVMQCSILKASLDHAPDYDRNAKERKTWSGTLPRTSQCELAISKR